MFMILINLRESTENLSKQKNIQFEILEAVGIFDVKLKTQNVEFNQRK